MIDGEMFKSLSGLLGPATFKMLYRQDIGPLIVAVKNLPEGEEGDRQYGILMHNIEKKYFCAGVDTVTRMVEAVVAKENGEG